MLDTGKKTGGAGKKTPGGAGTHTGHADAQRPRTAQTNLTTIQTHQQHTTRTSARRPKPRPTQEPQARSRPPPRPTQKRPPPANPTLPPPAPRAPPRACSKAVGEMKPVPGHLHALDLPTSGIDDEPLTPTAVSRERGAQNARRRSRWAIHAQVGDEHLAELAARTHQAEPEALGRVRSKPTARDLGGISSLQPRVPPRVRPGESEHEDIKASSRCCLPLGPPGP
jgi:hypothetical protein